MGAAMNIIRCLVEALNPCVHQYTVVATMYDDKDDPKVTTIISECEICGHAKRAVFKAEGVCFHYWKTLRRVGVWKDKTDTLPFAFSYEQQCEKCGDLREVKL
jgi:hypothetical protein